MTFMTSSVPNQMEIASYKIAAQAAASNPHWRKLGGGGSEEQIVGTIFSVMLLAREIGIPPMSAVAWGINNIQGKFEISARGMNQLIRKYGHVLKLKFSTDEMCIIWGKRKDTGEEGEEKFTIQEAARMGVIKEGGAWRKTPSDMLFARAFTRLGRRLFADCIGGFYIEGELQEAILKKPVEEIDTSGLEDIKNQSDVPEEALILPEHIDPEGVKIYLLESATRSKSSVESIRMRASKNMDKFLTAYTDWQAKQLVSR